MESVNVFIRPGGSSLSSHCLGRSCYNAFIAANKLSIRLHFPSSRFLIDHWPSDRLFMDSHLSGSNEISSQLQLVWFHPAHTRARVGERARVREREKWTLRKSSLCIDKQQRWIRLKPWVSTVSMSTVWNRHLTSFLPPGLARAALHPGTNAAAWISCADLTDCEQCYSIVYNYLHATQ